MNKRKRNDDQSDEEESLDELISVNENKIMFYSDVNRKSIFKLIKCIDVATKYIINNKSTDLPGLNNDKYIYIHICSDGGDLYPALSVCDIMIKSEINIITICEGCVASAGVLISLAGQTRYIREHSYMLIHEIRSGCNGKYTECKDDMMNNDKIMNDMVKYINERCNNKLLKKEMKYILNHDIIWDSKKCQKYGLIHHII